MHKNKKIRKGISLLLSFFLAVCFFVVFTGIVLKSAYLPGNAWRSYLLKSSYGSEMAEAAQKKLKQLLEERGLPVEVADDLLTEEALYAEYGYCMDDIWQERQQEPGRWEIFEEQLTNRIMDYLKEQQAVITPQLEQEVNNLVKEAGGIYDSYLNPGWLAAMITFEKEIGGTLTLAIGAAAVIGIICVVVLWQLYHYKHRAVRCVCYGMTAAFLWDGILLFFLNRTDWLAQSGIVSDAYRRMIQGICRNGTGTGLLIWGVQLLLLVLLGMWMKHLKHRTE